MSKNFFYTLLIAMVMLFSATLVFAQDFGLDKTAGKLGYDTTEDNPIYARVQTVVSVALSMVSIVFFILMTYAGLRWMTSRGNEELAAKAKHTLEAAVIGIIITVSAYAISTFILDRLGGTATNSGPTVACEEMGNGASCKDSCGAQEKEITGKVCTGSLKCCQIQDYIQDDTSGA